MMTTMMRTVLVFLVLLAELPLAPGYDWQQGPSDQPDACPGLYCGRTDLGPDSPGPRYSACGPCHRGWTVTDPARSSVCQKCEEPPSRYDCLYLGFIVLFTLMAHWIAIDFTAKCRTITKEVLVLHLSALLEVALAAVTTLVISQPWGQFTLTACKVSRFSDWYTLLYNPTPNYEDKLYCTHEAVYPLYSIVFIFYALALVFMIILRPILSSKFLPGRGRKAIYAALYFFPAFAVAHGVLGGVIYYSYSYIIIITSVVSVAAHLAFKLDQSIKSLVKTSVLDLRNCVILLGHWALHAYGILAVTELKDVTLHYSLISLVPLPALFYILTARFTDPERISGSGTQE